VSSKLQQPLLGVPQHPLRRNVPDAVLGGVCAGIACRLGVRPRTIRVVAACMCLFFGAGLLIYTLLWLCVRRDGETESIARRFEHQRRASSLVLWILVVVLAILVGVSILQLRAITPFAWSVLLSSVGLIAIWRTSSPDERRHIDDVSQSAPVLGVASARGWRSVVWRVIPATVLIIVGLQILNHVGGFWSGAVPALLGGIIFIVGALVMFAPWWLQNVRDLSSERRSRVRAEERAALVAHVHDSVLQTLTLIERSSNDPNEVLRLARAQERDLRAWLFAPDLIGVSKGDASTFAEQLHVLQNDVERDYGVRIELVIVGDCLADQRISDIVAAAREAAVNAARWSGIDHLSVYGEVEADEISMFVRDTGNGFDLDAVAADRKGLTHSIHERVRQAGGTSTIRSTPGEGTEVSIILQRVASP